MIKELKELINKYSAENGSNTPDFILAEYLNDCLDAFDKASNAREKWYGKKLEINPERPSEKAIQIAARIWCDQEMGSVCMDSSIATDIARIIDTML